MFLQKSQSVCLAAVLLLQLCVGLLPAQAQPLAYAPVSGQLSSGFGWRTDPINGSNRFHAGVDIAAPSGTPIYAPQNAKVAYSGTYKGYGNVVVLDHGYGLYTLYGHTSTYYVRAGEFISQGQVIAAVGTSGRSTGPHLHFEVHQNGQYVNPLSYLAYMGGQGNMIAYTTPKRKLKHKSTGHPGPPQVSIQEQRVPNQVDSDERDLADASIKILKSQANSTSANSQAPTIELASASPGIRVEIDASSSSPATHKKTVYRKRLGRQKNGVELVKGNAVETIRF